MPRRLKKQPTRLQDRDYELLEHVLRYRVTTREILHRLFFSDSEPNAATLATRFAPVLLGANAVTGRRVRAA